ncbi:MAG: response regulator [Anaerosomatales bacterium]|nr:response regulator [Anaerosomatales bacterium]
MSAQPSNKKCRVLIVEDTRTLRQMVKMTLEERGYEVYEAGDGYTGLQVLAERVPDAVVLDINLPDIDGFELCKRMKAEPKSRNIPVLMMTGMGQSGFEIMAIESGADDFIAKPVDPLVLDARIEMVVRRMRRERFANALTGLPSNALTEERLAFMLARGRPFGVAFLDIDGFRMFNKRYGHGRGDLVLRHLTELILESLKYAECSDPFVGHLGADDFLFICEPEKAEEVARSVSDAWDSSIMDFFEDEDRDRGYYVLKDRQGDAEEHGPLTLSSAVIRVVDRFPESVIALMDIGTELLEYARATPGSTVAVERRDQQR